MRQNEKLGRGITRAPGWLATAVLCISILAGACSASPSSGVFNVKDDYGALGNGSADDAQEIQAALIAAGNVCGTVFFPLGHYMSHASLVVPLCVTLQGVGRPSQFTYEGVLGSIIDFVGAPPGTDGLVSASGALQMVRISDLQIQRAPGECLAFEAVYAVIENISVKHCGGTGVDLGVSGSSYMFSLRNMFIYANGGDGLSIAAPGPTVSTTTILENVYAYGNAGTGVVLQNATSTSIIGSSADLNGESGFYISNSKTISFIGSDAESNGKSGFNWDTSSGTMMSTIASINNQDAAPGHANYVLAQASTVTIIDGFDIDTGGHSSINALSGSTVRYSGTFVGAKTRDGGSTNYPSALRGSWTPKFAAAVGSLGTVTVNSATYTQQENMMHFDVVASVSAGTGTVFVYFNAPSPAGKSASLSGMNESSSKSLGVHMNAGANTVFVRLHSGAFPVSGTQTLIISGDYSL